MYQCRENFGRFLSRLFHKYPEIFDTEIIFLQVKKLDRRERRLNGLRFFSDNMLCIDLYFSESYCEC